MSFVSQIEVINEHLIYIVVVGDELMMWSSVCNCKVVAPKRQSLAEAQKIYEEMNAKLKETWGALKTITDKLNGLNQELELKQQEKRVIMVHCCSISD